MAQETQMLTIQQTCTMHGIVASYMSLIAQLMGVSETCAYIEEVKAVTCHSAILKQNLSNISMLLSTY